MSISPGTYNSWVILAGATFDETIIWSSGGSPVNLTGYTAEMQIRSSPDSANPIITLSTSNNGILIPTPTNGTVELFIAATQTALLPPGIYNYDLQFSSGSEVYYLLQGTIKIQQMVTQ